MKEWTYRDPQINIQSCPDGSDGKESANNPGGPRFDPQVRKIPWRRELAGYPLQYFCMEKSMDRGAWRTIYPQHLRTSLVAQMVRNLPAMQQTRVRSLDQEIPWRREWLPTPAGVVCILSWRTPWTEESSPMDQSVKNPPAILETWVQSMAQGRSLGERNGNPL